MKSKLWSSSFFTIRLQMLGLKSLKAFYNIRKFLLVRRIRFLETGNLKLVWCHWISIPIEYLCNLGAHD